MVVSSQVIREVWENGYLMGLAVGLRQRSRVKRRRRGSDGEIIDITALLPRQRAGAMDGDRLEDTQ